MSVSPRAYDAHCTLEHKNKELNQDIISRSYTRKAAMHVLSAAAWFQFPRWIKVFTRSNRSILIKSYSPLLPLQS